MKKIIAILLSIVMIAVGLPIALAQGEPTIEISSATAAVGEVISVSISLKNNPGITGIRISAKYDRDAMTLVGSNNGTLLNGMSSSFPPNFDVYPYVMNWSAGTTNISGDGIIAELQFKINDDTADGTYEIEVTYNEEDIFNTAFENINFAVDNGIVTVSSVILPNDLSDFEYELTADGIIITGYNGTKANVVIGESYEIDGKTYDVVEIAESAFEANEDIKSVVIPATVKTIGDYAFYDCTSLVSVTVLGKDTEIGEIALGYYYISRREDGVVEGFTIYGYEGSTAEEYANTDDEIMFVALAEEDEECPHDGGIANCQEQAVCDLCGESYGDVDKSNHKTVVTDEAVAPSCYEDGLTEGSHCEACGEIIVVQETDPATGNHIYGTEWKANGNGTHSFKCTTVGCTAYGNTVVCSGGTSSCTEKAECSVCGSEYGGLNEHVYDNEIAEEKYLATDASCSAKAAYYKSCDCGLAGEATFEYGEKLEHTYPDVWTADEELGKHYKVCTVCGEGKITESCTASAWIVSKNATCQETGSQYKKCTVCQREDVAVETISVIDHNFVGAVKNATDGKHQYKCTNLLNTGKFCEEYGAVIEDEDILGATEDCSGGAANCVDKAVCDVCDKTYGGVDATNHKTVVTDDAVAPSCYEDGLSEGSHCEACGKTIIAQEVDPATGNHTYGSEWKANGDGTHSFKCTITGCTAYGNITNCSGGNATCIEKAECSVCGSEYGDYGKHTDISDNNGYCDICNELICKHIGTSKDPVEENRTESTCKVAGSYDSVVYCSVCGEELSRKIIDLPLADHTEGEAVVENRAEPICSVAGSYDLVVYCLVCDEELSRKRIVVPGPGHSPSEAVEENKIESTCKEAGSYDSVVYCSVCDEELSRDTIDLPLAEHTEGATVEENRTESTCKVAGSYDSVVYCSVCDGELSRDTIDIPLADHTEGEAVEENRTESTCEVAGSYDSVVYCSICGDELDRETVDLPLADHTEGAAVEENRAESTCKVAGSYDLVVNCSVCGDELDRETVALPLADHTEGAAVEENRTESTCKVAGSYDSVVYCSVCGDELDRETVDLPLAAHTEASAVEENRTESTCEVVGSYDLVIYCSVCGDELDRETVALPLADHTEGTAVEENRTESTCEVVGSYDSVVYCSVCDTELDRETIDLPLADHTEGDAVEENRIESTCKVQGCYESVVYCSVCDEELSRDTIDLPVADHIYSVVSATYNEEKIGTIVYSCDVCGDEMTETGSFNLENALETIAEAENKLASDELSDSEKELLESALEEMKKFLSNYLVYAEIVLGSMGFGFPIGSELRFARALSCSVEDLF